MEETETRHDRALVVLAFPGLARSAHLDRRPAPARSADPGRHRDQCHAARPARRLPLAARRDLLRRRDRKRDLVRPRLPVAGW